MAAANLPALAALLPPASRASLADALAAGGDLLAAAAAPAAPIDFAAVLSAQLAVAAPSVTPDTLPGVPAGGEAPADAGLEQYGVPAAPADFLAAAAVGVPFQVRGPLPPSVMNEAMAPERPLRHPALAPPAVALPAADAVAHAGARPATLAVAAATVAAAGDPQPAAAAAPALPGDLPRAQPEPAGTAPTPGHAANPQPPQAVPTQASDRPALDTPVRPGVRTFADDVGGRVAWMVKHGQQTAELRVDPPQLGPLEVRLTVSGDQANLTLLSPHAAVRDALQASLPRLQEMLLGSGVELGSVHVGSEASREGTQRDRQAQGAADASRDMPGWGASATHTPAEARPRLWHGLIDTYA
jgi:flagellar hook-length control protein FliK